MLQVLHVNSQREQQLEIPLQDNVGLSLLLKDTQDNKKNTGAAELLQDTEDIKQFDVEDSELENLVSFMCRPDLVEESRFVSCTNLNVVLDEACELNTDQSKGAEDTLEKEVRVPSSFESDKQECKPFSAADKDEVGYQMACSSDEHLYSLHAFNKLCPFYH